MNNHYLIILMIHCLKFIKKKFLILKKRNRLKRIINREANLQVIIGAGGTSHDGWVSTDLPQFNVIKEKDWEYYFTTNKPIRLLAEHVLEHLTVEQVERSLYTAYHYLKHEGVFRIAVPDAFHKNDEYLNAVRPGGWDAGAKDHKTFWNIETLKSIGLKTGFTVIPLEYFDEKHIFHMTDYNDLNGYIKRSKKNSYIDQNVQDYTSLIIDLVKT